MKQPISYQLVNLAEPIKSSRVGNPPLVLNIQCVLSSHYTENGPSQANEKNMQYVLLSSLPLDLQQKIANAVTVLLSGP